MYIRLEAFFRAFDSILLSSDKNELSKIGIKKIQLLDNIKRNVFIVNRILLF